MRINFKNLEAFSKSKSRTVENYRDVYANLFLEAQKMFNFSYIELLLFSIIFMENSNLIDNLVCRICLEMTLKKI